MSMRTIVEFNHDDAGRIERDPEGFLQAIKAMLNSGISDADIDHEERKRHDLERYGITTSPTHHHSTQAEVVLSHESGREYHRQRF